MLITFYPPPIPGLLRSAKPEKPADYLRRQWVTGAWKHGSWGERLLFALTIVLWWPTTILHAAYLAVRFGPARQRLYGKSPLRQFCEQIVDATRWLIPPLWYYTFDFCDEKKRAQAGDYVQRVMMKGFIYHWLIDSVDRKDKRYPFANKVYFSELCRRHGLSSSIVLAVIGNNRISFNDPEMKALPPVDLFVKIKNGRGGRGAEKWTYADGAYHGAGGRALNVEEFTAYLIAKSRIEKRIVQYCLVNHPALADLNLGALSTLRILTVRDEKGEIEATHAVMRMPQRPGAPVNNIHAGGIAAPIDLATGKLGRASDLGLSVGSRWIENHPETGAPILGREVPLWHEAVALCRRAHDLIGDRVVVGWDVAILKDGPCLVEGNGKPDVDLMQRPHGIGLGNTRFGELVAWHLKNFLAGDTRNGRR